MDDPKLKFPLFTWGDGENAPPDSPIPLSLFRLAEWATAGMSPTDICVGLFTSQGTAEMFARENPSIMAKTPRGLILPSAAKCLELLKAAEAKNRNLKWVAIDKVFLDHKFDLGLHPLDTILQALAHTPDQTALE